MDNQYQLTNPSEVEFLELIKKALAHPQGNIIIIASTPNDDGSETNITHISLCDDGETIAESLRKQSIELGKIDKVDSFMRRIYTIIINARIRINSDLIRRSKSN